MHRLAVVVLGCGCLSGATLFAGSADERFSDVAGTVGVVLVGHRLVAGMAALAALQVLLGLPFDRGDVVFWEELGVVGDFGSDKLSVVVSDDSPDGSSFPAKED